jgi:hypothetical protein
MRPGEIELPLEIVRLDVELTLVPPRGYEVEWWREKRETPATSQRQVSVADALRMT